MGPTTAEDLLACTCRLKMWTGDVATGSARPRASEVGFPAQGLTTDEWDGGCHSSSPSRESTVSPLVGCARSRACHGGGFMQWFLFQWQRPHPARVCMERQGLLEVVKQLRWVRGGGVRLGDTDPARPHGQVSNQWLDRLCLNGALMWGRLTPHPRLMQELGQCPGVGSFQPVAVCFAREDAPVLLCSDGRRVGAVDLCQTRCAGSKPFATVFAGSWRQFF